MTGEPQCAVGVPNVGPFGDPLLLVELAVAAEEHGWDGFFVWDHLLYHDQRWDVADPVAVIAAVAARTARIRIGILVNVLARRRIGEVARESVTVDLLSGGRLVVGAGLGRVDPPAAGHAEVEHHCLVAVGVDEAILGAAAHRGHPRAGQRLDEIGWERAAKVCAVDRDPRDPLAFEVAGEAANGGFDFGKLGHGCC